MAAGANMGYAGFLLILLCFLWRGESIWLSLPAKGTKCVSEEIHTNVVVLADYVVISDDHAHPTPTISTKVRDLFPFFYFLVCFVFDLIALCYKVILPVKLLEFLVSRLNPFTSEVDVAT